MFDFPHLLGQGIGLMIVLDAMNEAAWCYLEGFGCKKDKVRFLVLSAMCESRMPLTRIGLVRRCAVLQAGREERQQDAGQLMVSPPPYAV